MRFPEEKIKAAILHPEGEVRHAAVRYFSQSHLADATIMPVVTQALDRYDHHTNEDILWLCPFLPQSPTTIDWIMSKLEKPIDADDQEQDNHRYRGYDENLMVWMDPWLVELAGVLRLKEATASLLQALAEGSVGLAVRETARCVVDRLNLIPVRILADRPFQEISSRTLPLG